MEREAERMTIRRGNMETPDWKKAIQEAEKWKLEFVMAAEALHAHTSGGYVSKLEVDRIINLWRQEAPG